MLVGTRQAFQPSRSDACNSSAQINRLLLYDIDSAANLESLIVAAHPIELSLLSLALGPDNALVIGLADILVAVIIVNHDESGIFSDFDIVIIGRTFESVELGVFGRLVNLSGERKVLSDSFFIGRSRRTSMSIK